MRIITYRPYVSRLRMIILQMKREGNMLINGSIELKNFIQEIVMWLI